MLPLNDIYIKVIASNDLFNAEIHGNKYIIPSLFKTFIFIETDLAMRGITIFTPMFLLKFVTLIYINLYSTLNSDYIHTIS